MGETNSAGWYDAGEIRRRLNAEEARLRDAIGTIDDQQGLNEDEGTNVGELSSYDNHPADLGSETFEREKDIALKNNLRTELDQVAQALARLDAGTYGQCEACGRPIPAERLAAEPWATLCVECKTAREAAAVPWRQERVDTDPDAETWEAVATYGNADSPQDLPQAKRHDDRFFDGDWE